LVMVTDTSLLIDFNGEEQAYALDSIKFLRCESHDQ